MIIQFYKMLQNAKLPKTDNVPTMEVNFCSYFKSVLIFNIQLFCTSQNVDFLSIKLLCLQIPVGQ